MTATVAAAPPRKSAVSSGTWLPKLSERIGTVGDPAALRWLRQLGARHVVLDNAGTGTKGYLTAAEILKIKQSCQDADLTLEVMPLAGSRQLTMLGRPGRDEEIENACRTILAAGEAGVPTLMWSFTLDSYWDDRVGYDLENGRGGATYRAFEFDRVRNAPLFEEFGPIGEKDMWDRLLYFAKPVVAAAGKAGVRLALHPCDPPVPLMRGVPRIIHSPEDYLRFFKEVPGPANGMTFCLGVFTEMGTDVLAEIRRFGRLGKINLVHFRAVRGKVPRYTEVFMDEGDVNMIQAMKAYKEVGYTGAIVSDHTPLVEGDKPSSRPHTLADHGRVGTSFAQGYMRAAVQAVNTL
jgi:mannonate dehydratase